MSSYRTLKFNSERPGSSAKVYDYGNFDHESVEGSKIPKCPKRTYSLEGRRSTSSSRKTNAKQKVSTTSMIPRLERKKQCKKTSPLKISNKPTTTIKDQNQDESVQNPEDKLSDSAGKLPEDITSCSPMSPIISTKSVSSLESKVNKDFINFKNNVLRIPEYWADAGQTASDILKNAINIVAKQYPTVEKESFEAEIEGILKATDSVKQQILTRTENIINKATQIYTEKSETATEAGEEDLRKITRKMQELRNEVNVRKNVFGDLLKCGNEMKKLIELEKAIKYKGGARDSPRQEFSGETEENDGEGPRKREEKKTKTEKEIWGYKKREANNLQSCGDIPRNKLEFASDTGNTSVKGSRPVKEKTTQTINAWTAELHKREKNLSELNQQIIELQTLCKDHISKFKSFNLQIKLRGMCSKAQHMSVSKEIQSLNEEKMQLEEKNSKLQCYSKDLESAIKQKELDLHQKDKLINQQKKLLHVRDELIEMLKSRCNLEEIQRY